MALGKPTRLLPPALVLSGPKLPQHVTETKQVKAAEIASDGEAALNLDGVSGALVSAPKSLAAA